MLQVTITALLEVYVLPIIRTILIHAIFLIVLKAPYILFQVQSSTIFVCVIVHMIKNIVQSLATIQ
jgi:hypothetical protein